MSEKFDSGQRTPWDSVQFAITFFGFITVAAGIIGTSPALAILGFLLLLWGLGYFLIKQS